MELCIFPELQNFWMSGRCLDNFLIENGIIGNMNKLGIIVWDYEIFFHGRDVYVWGNHRVAWWNLFQDTIVAVAFGWDSRERFWKSSNGINVRPAKQWYEVMVGSAKVGDLLGNFQESETKVQSRIIWFKENSFENRKSFSGARKHY